MQSKHKLWVFLGGLAAILLVYTLYSIYFNPLDGRAKLMNKFVTVAVVYGIGTYALKKFAIDWMMLIWHLVHVSVFTILICMGSYYWLTRTVSLEFKNLAFTLLEFLISPTLYIGMGIINYKLLKQTSV